MRFRDAEGVSCSRQGQGRGNLPQDGTTIPDVTPDQARERWEEMGRPSYAKVADALKAEGHVISRKTIWLWARNDWKAGTPEPQPKPSIPAQIDNLELPIIEAPAESDGELVRQAARQALDAARRVFQARGENF